MRQKVGERARIGRTRVEVTRLGFGSAALGNLYATVSDEDAADAVAAALEVGIRYFDTAPYYGYGLAEQRTGQGLRAASGVGGDTAAISTKVGRLLLPRRGGPRGDQGFVGALPFDPVFDYGYDGVMRSFEASLARLGRDRVEILLLHDVGELTHGRAHPALFETAMTGGYRALDALRTGGAVDAIGLGVNEWPVCAAALERGDFDCFLLAGRYTLLEQEPLAQLFPQCLARGVSVIVGGPYNSGILADDPGPRSRYDYADVGDARPSVLTRARAIAALCAAHGVSLAAVALQFPLGHPAVACVIPGARSRAEVEANAAHLAHRIPEGLWRDLVTEGLLDPAAPTPAAEG